MQVSMTCNIFERSSMKPKSSTKIDTCMVGIQTTSDQPLTQALSTAMMNVFMTVILKSMTKKLLKSLCKIHVYISGKNLESKILES